MRRNNHLLLAVMIAFVAMFTSCTDDPPNPGFRIRAYIEIEDPTTGLLRYVRDQGRSVSGDLVGIAPPGSTGNIGFFTNEITNFDGEFDIEDGIAPANWDITENDGPCANDTITEEVRPGQLQDIYCDTFDDFYFFANPDTVDLNYPPSSVAIHGSGFSGAFGMPRVEALDEYGQVISTVYADEVAPNGTWTRGPFPSIPSDAPGGSYLLRVKNATGEIAGSAPIYTYRSSPWECNPSPAEVQACERDPWFYWDSTYCSCIAR